jgi:hypothetical protein
MKHFVVKVLVVVAVGLFALPRLQAQDTTITIYGKKFAPGVIVKINGKPVDSTNIKRDSAQPSRILYVKFSLSWLNKPAATIVAKGAEASLTSDEVGNTVEVGNPGTALTSYTIYTRPPSPRIALLPSASTDTIKVLQVRVPAASTGDTSLRVTISGTSQAIQSLRFTVKNARFQVYDSTGSTTLTSLPLQGSKICSFRLRFNAQDTVIQQDTLLIEGLNSSNAVLVRQRIHILGIPLNIIHVLAAYTIQSSKPYYVRKLNASGRPIEAAPDSIKSPKDFLVQSLAILNASIELTFDGTPLNKQTIFTRTRFTFINEPSQLSYQEQAEDSLFKDINALVNNDVGLNPTQIASADIALLLTNTSTTPYKAIANTCEKNIIPKFIIVEAKYAKGLMFDDFNLLFSDIQALIEKRQ